MLVQWKGYSQDEATWINSSDFARQFPEYNVEDKAAVSPGDIDKGIEGLDLEDNGPKKLRVYSRKKYSGNQHLAEE